MKIGKILFFIIFGIVVFVGIYIAISQTKEVATFNSEGSEGGESFLNTFMWWKNIGGSTSTKETEKKENESKTKSNNNQIEPPKPKVIPPIGFSEEDLSPFYKKVRISSVVKPSPTNYSARSGFTLTAECSNKEPISITGWRVRGNGNGEVFVPKGLIDYGLSGGGREGDIVLNPCEYAVFYNTQSPVNRNFRLSKCTGYLNNNFTFIPSLPKNCPIPFDRGEIITFPGECQSFLLSVRSCNTIEPNERNRFSGPNNTGCLQIMDRFTYGYCYNSLRNKPDFFSSEWRVWLGRHAPFDSEHDRILIFDNNGLLVNEYIY